MKYEDKSVGSGYQDQCAVQAKQDHIPVVTKYARSLCAFVDSEVHSKLLELEHRLGEYLIPDKSEVRKDTTTPYEIGPTPAISELMLVEREIAEVAAKLNSLLERIPT
jgi:hypothetical protein